jgi:hypothetical protein
MVHLSNRLSWEPSPLTIEEMEREIKHGQIQDRRGSAEFDDKTISAVLKSLNLSQTNAAANRNERTE